MFGESDQLIGEKVAFALQSGLKVAGNILCIVSQWRNRTVRRLHNRIRIDNLVLHGPSQLVLTKLS